MGMFLHYDNLEENYTPNNLKFSFPVGKSYTKLDPIQASKPYEEYNAKGELIGYSWYYGETVNLEFNINGEITVESDAIKLFNPGQIPSRSEGSIGQKAYNVVDLRSWKCTAVVAGVATWEEEHPFTYDETSSTSVYVSAESFLKNKTIEFVMYNFRKEPVYKTYFDGAVKIIVKIDPELSKQFNKGLYSCSLTVQDDKTIIPVFSSTDCALLVK